MSELTSTCATCADCAWVGMPLTIYSPANCRKLPELRMITGGGEPGRSVVLEIDDCPEFSVEIPDCGRFQARNPYLLKDGYHRIKAHYTDCDCVQESSVWVYIQAPPVREPVRLEQSDHHDSDRLDIVLKSVEAARCRGCVKLEFKARGYTGDVDVHYLLLSAGSPVPTAAQIMDYCDEYALRRGLAARGVFSRRLDASGTSFERAVSGLEANTALPGERSLLDGHEYDVYVYVVAGNRHSDILKSKKPVLTNPDD